MNDVAIALEHVDLLNGLDGLDIELLQRRLEFLVVGAGALVDLLDLSAGSSLAAIQPISLKYFVSPMCLPLVTLLIAGCGGCFAISISWCGAVKIQDERIAYPAHNNVSDNHLGQHSEKRPEAIPAATVCTYQCAPTPAYAPTLPDPYLWCCGSWVTMWEL